MGVGVGLNMYDVVVKSSRSLSHLLMSSCLGEPRLSLTDEADIFTPQHLQGFVNVLINRLLCMQRKAQVI